MAAPNLNSPTKVEGKVAVFAATTTAGTVLANATTSNAVLRIVNMMAANIDGTNAVDVSAVVTNGTVTASIVSTVAVPADASIVILGRDNPLYLPEGYRIQASASADSDAEIVIGYEEVT